MGFHDQWWMGGRQPSACIENTVWQDSQLHRGYLHFPTFIHMNRHEAAGAVLPAAELLELKTAPIVLPRRSHRGPPATALTDVLHLHEEHQIRNVNKSSAEHGLPTVADNSL